MQAYTSAIAMAIVKTGDLFHGNVSMAVGPAGPWVINEFQRIDLSPQWNVVVKVLDGFTLPKLLPEWPGIPEVARQPLFWVHAFLFITCEYSVSMVVNGGQPWWVEKLLMSLAWGALLACLPSAAAVVVRRIWGTRLRTFSAQIPATSSPSCPGQLCISCAEKAPEGWLPCDGSMVSRQDYHQLFAVISTTFGSGDGNTTFQLPDLQGKVAVGKAAEASVFGKLGACGGEASHVLQVNEMPAHTHNVHDQGHSHHILAKGRRFVSHGRKDFGVDQLGCSNAEGIDGNGHTDGAHSNISESTVGAGEAHNNMPPYIVMSYFIKY